MMLTEPEIALKNGTKDVSNPQKYKKNKYDGFFSNYIWLKLPVYGQI